MSKRKLKPKSRRVVYATYSLPPRTHRALASAARKHNRAMSQIVARGIELALAEMERKHTAPEYV